MLRPRQDEILRSLLWTFEQRIVPEVTSPYSKSLTLTMGNLFRHIHKRMLEEGQLLFDDNMELRALMRQLATYLEGLPLDITPSPEPVQQRISDVLNRKYYGGQLYPSIERLTEEATDMRGVLSMTISYLQSIRHASEGRDEYASTRQSIRTYLAHQIDRDKRLIEGTFLLDRR